MHPVRTTITTTANPLVLVALLWALLWGYGAGQLPLGLGGTADDAAHAARAERAAGAFGADDVWDESWSQRYPGCVALALWPVDEVPAGLLVRSGDDVTRVGPEVAQAPGPVVGACR